MPGRAAVCLVMAIACCRLLTGDTAPGHASPSAATERRMVITFDDLPYQAAGSHHYLSDGARMTDEIVRALARHRAPAVGFINESQLQVSGETARRTALLRQWVDAGLVLGNHTYSHADLNAVTVEQFEDEISRGDIVTRRLMERRRPYQLYFRHPYTHTGDTDQKKDAIERFLAERGYKVTPHTIENADHAFNVPYVRAKRSGDLRMQARLVEAYAEQTMAAVAFAEQMAPRIFGRDIPQTLLVHANDITADCLGQTLTALERRGYRFISLEEAMADPAYQTRDTVVTRFGPTWLWRWSRSKGLSLDFKAEPEAPAWVMDLYRERGEARTTRQRSSNATVE